MPTGNSETILDRIARAKRAELDGLRASVPQAALEAQIVSRPPGRLRAALLEYHPGAAACAVIAESKKASPSKGIICRDYDAVRIARSYERAGARAISVLTDREF